MKQRKVVTFAPATMIDLDKASEEAMCFDRLEASIIRRNAAVYTVVECGEVLKTVMTKLIACEASKAEELHVMPWSQDPLDDADARFTF